MTVEPANPQLASGRARVGRRPRLTMNQLLDAALEMGLERLTIAGLAARLGTGIAAVYRLVDSRDDLVLRAATHAFQTSPPPPDCGQSWQDYLVEYAERVFASLARDSHYMARFLEGGLGPEQQINHVEAALKVLVARGFEAGEALRVVRAVTLLVLGAATSTVHLDALRATHVGQAEAARNAIAKRPADQVTVLAGLGEAYGDEALMTDWRTPLRWLIDGLSRDRIAHAGGATENMAS